MTKASNSKVTEATVTEEEQSVEEVATVYLATDTLDHNDRRYKSGDVVEELTDEQAERLLAANVLVVSVPEHGVVLI